MRKKERVRTKSPRQRSIWQAVRRLEPYTGGYLHRWVFGLICGIFASLVALLIPQVIQHLVNTIVDASDSDADHVRQLWIAVGVIGLLGIAEATLILSRRFLILPASTGIETRARVSLFHKLQHLPVRFHDVWPSGQLLSRSISDLALLRRWISFGTVMFIVSLITVIAGIGLMFAMSWVLGTIYVVGAIPIMIRSYSFRTKFRTLSRRAQDQAGDVATEVEESVHGIRVLKAFGRAPQKLQQFTHTAQRLRTTEVQRATEQGKFIGLIVALPEVVLGIGLATGLYLTATDQLSVGTLAAFFATAAVLAGPVESVAQLMGMALSAKTAIDRHLEVMDTENSITSGAVEAGPRRGALEFRGVEFHYPTEADSAPPRPLLGPINLTLNPGETMALVGVTGSGKSTLMQLVPRLYDVTGGAVLVDGTDVRDLDLNELRSRVSIAFEEPTLFSDTVENNVLLGTNETQHTQHTLDNALEVSHSDFVDHLPHGNQTHIGEEGLSLSGGQRQRLSLARAIAANPSVLLLDDPLSAVDVRTEEHVTAQLREALASTTTLIVAHRPSTVALADRVALLEGGRIVDVGAHTELLARSETYRHIISSPEDPLGTHRAADTEAGS